MSDSAMHRMHRKAVDIEPKDSSRQGRGLKMNNITCILKSLLHLTVIVYIKLNMNSNLFF